MKTKNSLFLSLLFMLSMNIQAQFVTIPDTNFVKYLQTNFPTCMSGNMMDTTCAGVLNANGLVVDSLSIKDLTGLEYFKNCLVLYCSFNQLTSLPTLPDSLETLDCIYNQLTVLPILPNTLTCLRCFNNKLTSLPTLPDSLSILYCFNNLLASLPTLPTRLRHFSCSNNQISYLPNLPISLELLNCSDNNISCFPKFPETLLCIDSVYCFSIKGNPFTCLPNYISAMDAFTLSYPLCVDGNPNGCQGMSAGITGTIYQDKNSNCMFEATDSIMQNISIKLFDLQNKQLTETNTFMNGIYAFANSAGTYTVVLDTANKPYTVKCPQGIDSLVTLTDLVPLVNNVNFEVACKAGFDVGVQSVVPVGLVFPGQQHTLSVVAGDMSQWYHMNCAAGTAGQVQITVTGPVAFVAAAMGALTPSVAGNVFTYTISDFGMVDIDKDFKLIFTTDTSAQANELVNVNVYVTPSVSDYQPLNNSYAFNYAVRNSFDPNDKSVSPINVAPDYNNWFTYTINFQNTGNAPAINIRLTDTLDTQLDASTFEMINHSHATIATIISNTVTFRMSNINLPDSVSNEAGSKGYVQYRIKPKQKLVLGNEISNKAYIYFDYNAPVITNTTKNKCMVPEAIKDNDKNVLSVFPNPFTSTATIHFKHTMNNAQMSIYNVYGQKVYSQNAISGNTIELNRGNLSSGIYFISLTQENKNSSTVKVIITD